MIKMNKSFKSLDYNELNINSEKCDLYLWVKEPGKEISGIPKNIKCGIELMNGHGDEIQSLLTSDEVIFLYKSLGKLIKKYKIKE